MDNNNVKCNFLKDIEPKLKELTLDTIKAVSRKIDPNRRHCSFEVSYSFPNSKDIRLGLHDRREHAPVADRSKHEPQPGNMLSFTGQTNPLAPGGRLQDSCRPNLPTARLASRQKALATRPF